MATNYNISETGIKLIKHFESLHDGDLKVIGLQPKMDPSGIWTEGWGHAILDAKGNFVKGLSNKTNAYKLATVDTEAEAEILLHRDLESRIATVNKIGKAKTQSEFDAHVSFTYNCGAGNYSKLLLSLKSCKNDEELTNVYLKYSYSAGKQLPGLKYRRMSEALLATTGVLKFFN